jgi:hypothetical protein
MARLPSRLFPTETMNVRLSPRCTVDLPVCRPTFQILAPEDGEFTFGRKPLTLYYRSRMFVELRIAKELIRAGWDAVWVETYNGTAYLRTMIDGWNPMPHSIGIPKPQRRLVEDLIARSGHKTCFDVMAWSGKQCVFMEAKRAGHDSIGATQKLWIKAALEYGIPKKSLIIVEWRPA